MQRLAILVVGALVAGAAEPPGPERITGDVLARALSYPGALKLERLEDSGLWARVGKPVWFLHAEAPDGAFPPTGIVLFQGRAYLTAAGIAEFETEMHRQAQYLAGEDAERRRRLLRIETPELREHLLRNLELFLAEAPAKARNRKTQLADGRPLYTHRGWKFCRAEFLSPDSAYELVIMVSSEAKPPDGDPRAAEVLRRLDTDPHGVARDLAHAIDRALFETDPASTNAPAIGDLPTH